MRFFFIGVLWVEFFRVFVLMELGNLGQQQQVEVFLYGINGMEAWVYWDGGMGVFWIEVWVFG